MKKNLYLFFWLFTLFLPAEFLAQCSPQIHLIQFNAKGQLLLAPTDEIRGNDSLLFVVREVKEHRRKAVKRTLDYFLEGLETMKKQKDKAKIKASDCYDCTFDTKCTENLNCDGGKIDEEFMFGIEETDFDEVYKEMYTSTYRLLNQDDKLLNTQEQEYYKKKMETLGTYDNKPELIYVPNAIDLANDTFEIRLKLINEDGSVKLETIPLEENLEGLFTIGKSRNTSVKIEFELRRKNNFLRQINEWGKKHEMDDDLRHCIQKVKENLKKQKEISGILARWQKLTQEGKKDLEAFYRMENLEKKNFAKYDVPNSQLREALCCLLKLKKNLSEKAKGKKWIANWLWLTKGKPMLNPLQAISPAALNTQLKKDKAKLALLTAQIASFEMIVQNQGFDLGYVERQYNDGVVKDGKTIPKQKTSNVSTELEKIAKVRTARDELSKKVKATTAKIAKLAALNQGDELLYKGLLFLRGNNPKHFTIYHDALNQYKKMGDHRPREIGENRKVHIIATNETPGKKLQLEQTTTAIDTDNSLLTNELAFSLPPAGLLSAAIAFVTGLDGADGAGAALVPPPPAPSTELEKIKAQLQKARKDERKKLLKELKEELEAREKDYCKLWTFYHRYAQVKKCLDFLNGQLSTPQFPIKISLDQTPNYLSREIPSEQQKKAPAEVTYTINSVKKDGTKEALHSGGYRLNKLYRVRFKAGLVYNFMEDPTYSIVNGEASVIAKPYGVDGTFGLQIYPVRRDIRKEKQFWQPVTYIGFSMRELTKNLYLGGGFEPWSGVTFLGGCHFREVEQLVYKDMIPNDITKTWKNGWFIGLTLDASLFRDIFGF